MVLKIGNLDITPYLTKYKPYPNTMVTNEGRNAKGTMRFDIVATKAKIETEVMPLPVATSRSILSAVSGYTVTCQYLDVESGTMKTISAYVPNPQVEYEIIDGSERCKAFSLNIIEM